MGMGYWRRHCDGADIGRALSSPLLRCTLLRISLLSSSLLLRWSVLRVWIPPASLLSLSLLSSLSVLSPLSSISFVRLPSSPLVRHGQPSPQLTLTLLALPRPVGLLRHPAVQYVPSTAE